MKTVLAVAAFAALSFAAPAGDPMAKGYRCESSCPLAVKANHFRSYGQESFASSKLARADLARAVVANLERI
jgi:hypothetical protein